MSAIPTNIADHVGRTPIVRLTRITGELEVELFAKLEASTPVAASRTGSAWR